MDGKYAILRKEMTYFSEKYVNIFQKYTDKTGGSAMEHTITRENSGTIIMTEGLAMPPAIEPQTGRDLIEFITTMVGIKSTMVAALLNVTERTLNNWSKEKIDAFTGNKSRRLLALYTCVKAANDAGITGKQIMNLLDEPIPGEPEEKSILYYVVDEPDNGLLATALNSVIKQF